MAWSDTAPDGSQSVKANESILQGNTTYIKTTLDIDHYWNDGANTDGHHRFVQMAKSETGGTPSDPTVATAMDGVAYLKQKTATEQPGAVQSILPFFKDDAATPAVMELLGIRAMAMFSAFNGTITPKYVHNINPAAGTGIVRTAKGKFTITFKNALPTANYLILGGCINNNSANDVAAFYLESSTVSPPTTKTANLFKIQTYSVSGSPAAIDPNEMWFICFGG